MFQNYTNGLHYLTVKNAGHIVVSDQREIGKYIFDEFIAFNYLPKNNGDDINENNGGKNLMFISIIIIGIVVMIVLLIFFIFKCVIKNKRVTFNEIEGPLSTS